MSDLIPPHGGYRRLKSFQVSQLVHDVTVRFCDRWVDARSRTRDQMVQAARSGAQNIAEGSVASATSKKTELKLTQVARASLEELKLDYEDYLRQRGLPKLEPDHPVLVRFKELKPQTAEQFDAWVEESSTGTHGHTDKHGRTRTNMDTRTNTDAPGLSVPVGDRPCRSVSPRPPLGPACLAANGALSLLNLACYLLDRQVARLGSDFERNGGFTERLYRERKRSRGW